MFVEGTGQSGLAYNWGECRDLLCVAACWLNTNVVCHAHLCHWCAGDGLASTAAALGQYRGISDAGRFFEQVMSKPYLNQVCCLLLDTYHPTCYKHSQQHKH